MVYCRAQIAGSLKTEYNDLGGWLESHQLPVVYSNAYNIGFMASPSPPRLLIAMPPNIYSSAMEHESACYPVPVLSCSKHMHISLQSIGGL